VPDPTDRRRDTHRTSRAVRRADMRATRDPSATPAARRPVPSTPRPSERGRAERWSRVPRRARSSRPNHPTSHQVEKETPAIRARTEFSQNFEVRSEKRLKYGAKNLKCGRQEPSSTTPEIPVVPLPKSTNRNGESGQADRDKRFWNPYSFVSSRTTSDSSVLHRQCRTSAIAPYF
jgi:hypothetical protein